MNSKDYRKLNTLMLIKEVGSVSALAALAGSSQSYLSQIVGPNAKREMGDDIARRLEYVCKKPHGWIDEIHIEESKLAKAREIYEVLLRFDEKQLDALVTLLGFSQANSERLGSVKIEDSISFRKTRTTDLGTEKIGRSKESEAGQQKRKSK